MSKSQSTIGHIIIERIDEADGSFGWTWDAYAEGNSIASGAASSLPICVDSVREYFRDEGIAPEAVRRVQEWVANERKARRTTIQLSDNWIARLLEAASAKGAHDADEQEMTRHYEAMDGDV